MTTRTEAAARLLSEKLDLDLPPALLTLALNGLGDRTATAAMANGGQVSSASAALLSAAEPADPAIDTRPLAGIIGTRLNPQPGAGNSLLAALQQGDGDLARQLPQLMKQVDASLGTDRRAELSAMAAMVGALLGGTRKQP